MNRAARGPCAPLALPLLLLLPACAPAVRPPSVPPAPAAVVLDEPQVAALAGLLRMEDSRALDLEPWTELLRAPEAVVRARAALAAGRIGDPRTPPLLLEALADSVPTVRAAAVFALGRLTDSAAAVVAGLGRALAGTDSAALAAPAALARINTLSAYHLLAQRLAALRAATSPDQLALVREALLALWRFRQRPGAPELAAGFAGAPDPGVRWAATYALTRLGTPAQLPLLLERAADADPLVRATALRGIRPGAADSAGVRAAATAALRELLADSAPHVRINAARALGGFRDPTATAALQPLLRDSDGNVRAAAAEALGNLPSPGAAGALAALARQADAALALRTAALTGLARTDTTEALRIAASWAGADRWLQRFYAARVLGGLPWPHAGELLQRLSRDADPRVQGEAFGGLAGADSTLPLAPLFLEGLAAPDPLVRAHAAGALGRRGDSAYYSALLQAYERAQQDTLNDAALAAVDALADLAARGVPVASSFFLRFRPARDPVVRARVAQRLGTGPGTWGEPRPVPTGRTEEFYREVIRREVAPVLAGGAPPRVRIGTAHGDIVLALDPLAAPLTVHNFLALIERGFYRRPELRWHRVVPNFVLQDGDPRGDGSGGPVDVIRDELNLLRYERGVLGMALSGPDTGGSQFFITHSPQPHLDGGYTIFGRVVEGMEAADAVLQDDAILAMEVVR